VAGLIDRLAQNNWWGAIIGPHGSGKSTLLATLLPVLEQAGRRPLLIALHDGQTQLPPGWLPSDTAPETIIVVDGYEQLSLFSRWRLTRCCRRRGLGLLATAHGSVGLPQLVSTQADLKIAQRVVERLVSPLDGTITPSDVAECLPRHAGNLREMLFQLYDLYERRRRGPAAKA